MLLAIRNHMDFCSTSVIDGRSCTSMLVREERKPKTGNRNRSTLSFIFLRLSAHTHTHTHIPHTRSECTEINHRIIGASYNIFFYTIHLNYSIKLTVFGQTKIYFLPGNANSHFPKYILKSSVTRIILQKISSDTCSCNFNYIYIALRTFPY